MTKRVGVGWTDTRRSTGLVDLQAKGLRDAKRVLDVCARLCMVETALRHGLGNLHLSRAVKCDESAAEIPCSLPRR